ncbi:hypothetical protein SAMN02910358_00581 [Lachnospiraceae bacterium XBB1006]|nr:hypothetical protein SAMN02910358_00581 [Lachnospiraceae bacterium XBB1006]
MSILDTFLGGHQSPPRRPVKVMKETTKEKNEVSMKLETDILKEEIDKLAMQTEALTHAVDENKNAIIEKVHVENVKAFKNVQAILNELDEKMAKAEMQNRQMESLKIYVRCGTWFSIMNLLVLVVYILFTQGVF